MSYELRYLDDEGNDVADCVPLATNCGWGDFGRWAESLPSDSLGEMELLYRNGHADTIEQLEIELVDAIQNHPPDSADTLHTAKDLLASIRARPEQCDSLSVE